MDNTEKIQRAITRAKCGTPVKEACKAEGLAPPVLYQSDEYKAYKAGLAAEAGDTLPAAVEVGGFTPYIKIMRLEPTGDPRDPLFKVETRYAGEATIGEHYFGSIQALVAQLPQLAFGLTP